MINLQAGMVLHVTKAASPQFVKPIFFRLIRVRKDLITYQRWAWLEGYQLDEYGDAVTQRAIYVQPAGLIVQTQPFPAPHPQPRRPRRANAG
ncbi:hypothetical protein [Micromonospora sp. DT233]|uniref:hypothetical protein n=1 Tax=Micromonospora sp. DT233 TaxID=3393432 RepID=UPI003CEAB8A3